MKKIIFLLSFFCAVTANAQDYYINFAGEGASSTVSFVKVENLTSGLSVDLSGSDILHLVSLTTGFNMIKDENPSGIKIYPNPVADYARLEFYPPADGEATVSVRDITGLTLTENRFYLEKSRQDFSLSGMKTGLYVITVKGKNYQISGKLLSNGKAAGRINLEKTNSNDQSVQKAEEKKVVKGMAGTIDMTYASGERLKFTGTTGIYSTTTNDIPTSDKTIKFYFIVCTDADANNYPVVEIGDQYWMGSNLRSRRFNDGIFISYGSAGTTWTTLVGSLYSYSNHTYNDLFGHLYNWKALEYQNICPTGWHLPSNTEWIKLKDYLVNNNYAYDGSGTNINKALASNTMWTNSTQTGTIGNDQASNNITGFSAFPTGFRNYDGQYLNGGNYAGWWTAANFDASNVWSQGMFYDGTQLINSSNNKKDGLAVRCVTEKIQVPDVTTGFVLDLTKHSVTSGGTVTNECGSAVTARGVCWSTSVNPTIADHKTTDGSGTGAFTSSLTGLTANTTYHLRAWATNSTGTNYGNERIFKTYRGSVTDVEGNVYNTVTIGIQVWMAENLKTTKYNDATPIPMVTDNTEWADTRTPAYCWYNNDATANKNAYGALYNWYVVSTVKNGNKNVCPVGWHVPPLNSYGKLLDPIDKNYSPFDAPGEPINGPELMEAGTAHWQEPMGSNETGFSGLPGGYRKLSGIFTNLGNEGMFWSSNNYGGGGTGFGMYFLLPVYKSWGMTPTTFSRESVHGFSIRCVKDDQLPTLTTAEITNITQTGATGGGTITSDSVTITSSGLCIGTEPNPTTSYPYNIASRDLPSFSVQITNLLINTKYYVRAFAANNAGAIAYGNEVSFTTKMPGPILFNPNLSYGSVSDIDGNVYKTIQIGSMTWMAENLKTTKYNNGNPISNITDNTVWLNSSTGAYCWYNNDETTFKSVYGALYNWYAVNTGNICPTGWHVPYDSEWHDLVLTLDASAQNAVTESLTAGGKLKETGTSHWEEINDGISNENGFTAIASGYRSSASFSLILSSAYYWGVSDSNPASPYYRMIMSTGAIIRDTGVPYIGMSVRCVKD